MFTELNFYCIFISSQWRIDITDRAFNVKNLEFKHKIIICKDVLQITANEFNLEHYFVCSIFGVGMFDEYYFGFFIA